MTGLVLALLVQAQPDAAQFFEEKVRPLLAARCWGCHGDAKVSGLRLDSREGMLAGGRSGAALTPGNPGQTLFLQAVRRTHEKLKMPPDGKLAEGDIATLESWVRDGAFWPATAKLKVRGDRRITAEDRNWWAFRPLPPATGSIDWHVDGKHRELELKAAPPADRRTLIRRLSFDLTGLPPRDADMEGDLAAIVDRMLASPRFGERWARYWLDVARYGEDDVLGLSQEKYPNAWRYRDWVVEAFNRDLPYDVFVKAQIAGDLMEGDYGLDLRPALGFFGLGPWQYTVSPPPQARSDERHDRIDVVTRGFLGLTVGCARCHDHKFDPISTKDYYALAGIFGSTEYREYPLAPKQVVEAYEAHQQKIRDKEKQIKEWLANAQEAEQDRLSTQIAAEIRSERWQKYLGRKDRDQPLIDGLTPDQIQAIVLSVRAEKKQIDGEKRRAVDASRPMKMAKTRLPNGFELYDDFCPGCDVAVRSLERDRYVLWQEIFREPSKDTPGGVLWVAEKDLPNQQQLKQLRAELEQMKKALPPAYPFLHGVADKERPANLKIALRGDPYRLGEEAPRRFVEILWEGGGEPEVWSTGSGRLQLGEAIVKQPLAARVAANRVWMHLFGRGITNSPSNFGRFGDRPANPALLEYLAARLVENRWSVKSLIREIVLSATYRRSSAIVEVSQANDPDNKQFWRANRRRLDAEALRDSLLDASGQLDGTVGGPPEEIGPEMRRRTIYGRVSRFKLNETLALFDFPSPSITAEKRVVTHVPLQRLYFLNNDFVTRQAKGLAARTQNDVGRAYRILYNRGPSDAELQLAQDFLKDSNWPDYARVLLTSNEFLFVD
ncbi:MAG: PSD1 domain-containing protein [Bryobacterales bacterium]|nr:PSD1 domain-containing protein [Bryobacterales bacterium]